MSDILDMTSEFILGVLGLKDIRGTFKHLGELAKEIFSKDLDGVDAFFLGLSCLIIIPWIFCFLVYTGMIIKRIVRDIKEKIHLHKKSAEQNKLSYIQPRAREIQAKIEKDKKQLEDNIQGMIYMGINTPNSQIVKDMKKDIEAYNALLNLPVENDRQVDNLEWLYNDGSLRTEEELQNFLAQAKKSKTHERKKSEDVINNQEERAEIWKTLPLRLAILMTPILPLLSVGGSGESITGASIFFIILCMPSFIVNLIIFYVVYILKLIFCIKLH